MGRRKGLKKKGKKGKAETNENIRENENRKYKMENNSIKVTENSDR